MENIILDFSNCKYVSELHKVMKEAFSFPDYYGENLDALWDCLDCYSNENILVIIQGTNTLPNDPQKEMAGILEVFCDVTKHNPNIIFEIIS